MCQMCDEYEAELRRMGLMAEADEVHAQARREHEAAQDKARGTEAPPRDKASDARG